MKVPAFLQLSIGDLRMPFSDEITYIIVGLAVLLFLVAAAILAWQIYQFCKHKSRTDGNGKGTQSTEEKSMQNGTAGTDDGDSQIQRHNYKVAKLQDKIEKLSRCLSPTSSLSELDSMDLDSPLEDEDGGEMPRGCLRFSLFYDSELSRLVVTVLDAGGLPVRDFSHSVDPFVRVRLLSGPPSEQSSLCCVLQEWDTRLVKNSRSPSFGDQFSYSLPEDELPAITVKLEVKDFDKYSRHNALGEVRRPLKNVNLHYPMEVLEELQALEKDLVGEVLLSLKYLPTSQRIEVGLLKIKTVSHSSHEDKVLYARTSLSCNQCKLKQQKTPLKPKLDVTVFNEILTFSLPDPQIRECIITVHVYEVHTERKKSKHLIGRLVLRKRKTSEDEHWSRMMQCVRQPVAKWHPLYI